MGIPGVQPVWLHIAATLISNKLNLKMNVKFVFCFLYFVPLVYGKPQDLALASAWANLGPTWNPIQCFGSIEFLLPSEELRMVTSEQLVSRNNRILRINSEFTAARVNGNCCWELYPRYRFRGSKITMGPSEEKRLDFNPKSLKVKNC